MTDRYPLPPVFAVQDVDGLMKACVEAGASDVLFQSGDYVWAEIYGRQVAFSSRRLSDAEIRTWLSQVYGSNTVGLLAAGEDVDRSMEIRVSREKVLRFRLNATNGRVYGGGDAVSVTMRSIPEDPPKLDALNIEGDLQKALFPDAGLVLVIGATGSGKTTLLSACVRHLMEHEDRKILTYEAPIEFTYDRVLDRLGPLPCQTEIGLHLPTFARGVRNALRRKPGVIVCGEARDRETMDATVEAALTGHLVYATLHAETVPESLMRAIHLFPSDAQSAAASKLLGALKVAVAQKLLKTVDGKRTAVREYVVFDEALKMELERLDYIEWPGFLRGRLSERGESMRQKIRAIYEAGVIDHATAQIYGVAA